MSEPDPIAFLHDTTFADLPPEVRHQTARCILDLCGAVVAGRHTPLSAIVRDHAASVYGGDQATLLLDGRRVSAPGAALATGMGIDAFDIHDSHRESLGHAGVHLFAALLAVAELRATRGVPLPTGEEFVTAMAVGYDLACRAGEALHGTVSDYHTSGAWGAVSAAGLYARLMGFDRQTTREALGIAEYHGPRSQMMRCIDHPTMVKDGSGWGAMTGVQAGMLAEAGFTGAPALTVESRDAAGWWSDLGRRWSVMDQGFKAHGSCWWSQPPIEAVLALTREHDLRSYEVRHIRIETFAKAVHLDHPDPETTEQAQYSVPFPVAAALVKSAGGVLDDGWYGLGPAELLEASLHDPETRRLAAAVELVEAPELTAAFPKRFLARATLSTVDGRTFTSPDTTFRGELDDPFTDAELTTKFRWLAGSLLAADRVAALEERGVGDRRRAVDRSPASAAGARHPIVSNDRLEPGEVVPGRPFTTVGHGAAELQVMNRMLAWLRWYVTEVIVPSAAQKRDDRVTESDGSQVRLAMPDVAAALEPRDIVAVGFFGQARMSVDHSPIIDLEAALIADVGGESGLLCTRTCSGPAPAGAILCCSRAGRPRTDGAAMTRATSNWSAVLRPTITRSGSTTGSCRAACRATRGCISCGPATSITTATDPGERSASGAEGQGRPRRGTHGGSRLRHVACLICPWGRSRPTRPARSRRAARRSAGPARRAPP